jgi:hypothetical protein
MLDREDPVTAASDNLQGGVDGSNEVMLQLGSGNGKKLKGCKYGIQEIERTE